MSARTSSTSTAAERAMPAGGNSRAQVDPEPLLPADRGSWVLVEAAKAGDREAFAQLYRDYAPRVAGFVHGRLRGDHHLVEDLTSETFLRAWRRIDTVHDQGRGRDVGAWLTTIARNLVVDHYKAVRTRRDSLTDQVPEPAVGSRGVAAAADERVFDRLDRAAAALAVHRAAAGLSPAQRDMVARELREETVPEIAEATGRAPSAVRSLRRRTVRAMAERLTADGLSSTEQCRQAVGRARDAVGQLAEPRHSRVAEPPAYQVPQRCAGQSTAAAVGLQVSA